MKYHTTHSILCNVKPEIVFSILSEVEVWPNIMKPCKKARVIEKKGINEIIEITADINGIEMTWQSKRRIYKDILKITADIFKPMEPAKKMIATWQVYNVDFKCCLVMLNHDFDIKEDLCELIPNMENIERAEEFLIKAIDKNTTSELKDIKVFVEKYKSDMECYNFSKILPVPAFKVYNCLKNVKKWTSRFNNCKKIKVLKHTDKSDIIQVWIDKGNEVVNWITKRKYIDKCYRIEYEFKKQMPLLNKMFGEWQVIPIDKEKCMISVNRFWVLKEFLNRKNIEKLIFDFISKNTEEEINSIVEEILNSKKIKYKGN